MGTAQRSAARLPSQARSTSSTRCSKWRAKQRTQRPASAGQWQLQQRQTQPAKPPMQPAAPLSRLARCSSTQSTVLPGCRSPAAQQKPRSGQMAPVHLRCGKTTRSVAGRSRPLLAGPCNLMWLMQPQLRRRNRYDQLRGRTQAAPAATWTWSGPPALCGCPHPLPTWAMVSPAAATWPAATTQAAVGAATAAHSTQRILLLILWTACALAAA